MRSVKLLVFAAAFAAGVSFSLRAADASARMKMGVLSDIHIQSAADGGHDDRWFVKALEYFRDNGADAVMIAGDMADRGLVAELEYVAAAWYRVFPNDRAAISSAVIDPLNFK